MKAMSQVTDYSLRPLMLVCAMLALLPATSISANKQIDLDLDVTRLARPGIGDRGPVVISSVTDGRSLSPAGASDPSLQNVLVGQYLRSSNSVYDVILVGGEDVTDIVADVIAMNLRQLGYVVVESDSDAAIDAPGLAIVVDQFWVEFDPAGGTNRKSFDCTFRFTIVSDAEPFDGMAAVSGTGFRNGSRPTYGKSYSNSLLHSLKFVMQDFEAKYNASLRNFAQAEYSSDNSAVDRILEAKQLRDDGIITDEEFQQLKEKILSE